MFDADHLGLKIKENTKNPLKRRTNTAGVSKVHPFEFIEEVSKKPYVSRPSKANPNLKYYRKRTQ